MTRHSALGSRVLRRLGAIVVAAGMVALSASCSSEESKDTAPLADPLKDYEKEFSGEAPAPLLHEQGEDSAVYGFEVDEGQGEDPVTVRVRCSPKTDFKVLFKPEGGQVGGECSGDGDSSVTLPPGEGVESLELRLSAASEYWLLVVPDDATSDGAASEDATPEATASQQPR